MPRTAPPILRACCSLLACTAAPAWGLGFTIDDDIRGVWNNTLTLGAGWRSANPDPALVGVYNRDQYPGAKGAVSVADDGNLNYRKGDRVATPLVWLSDLEVRYRQQFGALVRTRAWYDLELNRSGVPHGSINNAYVPGAKLNDDGFYRAEKFDGIELLDAYVYGNVELGENRLSARLGQQVVNWGEGLLYTGINAFNPLNLAALATPGSRPEQALLPVNRVYASLLGREGWSVDAFYTLDWQRNTVPGCGTLGQPIDSQANPGCFGATIAPPVLLPDRVQYQLGLYAPVLPAIDGSKSGQWGIAGRYFVEPLRTEFGLYYVRFNNPMFGVNIYSQSTGSRVGVAIQNQYTDGVQGAAVSAVTGYRNLTMSAELSTFFGLPVQRNFPTLVQGAAQGVGPYAAAARTGANVAFPGTIKVDRTQLLLGSKVALSPWITLADALLTAEVALQWAPDLPGTDQERIGRNPNFGVAAYPGAACGPYDSCAVRGFATPFNWGYRLGLSFSLPRPTNGLDLQPTLLWSQDVKGYAVDGSMVEGRYIAGAQLRAVYQQFLFAQIGAAWVRSDTSYDAARDKSSYSLAVGVRF